MTKIGMKIDAYRLRQLNRTLITYMAGAFFMLGLVGAYLQLLENSAFDRLSRAAREEALSVGGWKKLPGYLSRPLREQFDHLSHEEKEVLLLLAYVARLAHDRDLNFGRFPRPKYLPRIGVRDHLNDPGGKCTSYTLILGKLLRSSGYEVRKVGLASSATGARATHHVLEVRLPATKRWALLDTIFAHAFVDAKGHLRSAGEVRAAWQEEKRKLPAGYNAESFGYESMYYTNWQRIPGFTIVEALMPGADAWLQAHEVALPFFFQMRGYGWVGAVAFGASAIFMALTRLFPRKTFAEAPAERVMDEANHHESCVA